MKNILLIFILATFTSFAQIWNGVAINPAYPLNKVIKIGSTGTMAAVGDGGAVFVSLDKGLNWSLLRSGANGEVLHSIAVSNTNDVWAVGNGGMVLRAEGGLSGTFNQVQIGTQVNLKEVYFIKNTAIGFIVGENSTMLKTTNSGATWTPMNFNQSDYMFTSITFHSANVGVAVTSMGSGGSGGKVLVTENGGAGWFPLTVPNIGSIFSVAMDPHSSGNIIYASGESGVIKSTNRGLSWQNITNRLQNYIYGAEIQSPEQYTVLVLTNGGVMYSSFDGGETFQHEFAFSVGTGLAMSFCTANSKNITVVGSPSLPGIHSVWNRIQQNTLGVHEVSVFLGDTAKVPVYLIKETDEEFFSVQSYFTGYNQKLTFLGTSSGPLGSTLIQSNWSVFANETSPVLRLIGFGSNNIVDPQALIYLNFKTPQSMSGFRDTIMIKIDSGFINTNDIPLLFKHGRIILKKANPGDVDLNGTVQAFDASLILRYLANLITLNADQLKNAEVTNDNTVTALDASTIGRYLAGLVPSLPWAGTSAVGSPVMNDMSGQPGQFVSVPIYLTNSSGVFSYEGKLSYDIDKFEFSSLTFSNGFAGAMHEYSNADGIVAFAFAATQDRSLPANEAIAILKLRVRENALINSQSVITLSSFRLNQNALLQNSAQTIVHITTSVDNNSQVPSVFALEQNYPNPFNPATRISFSLPGKSMVLVDVYDLTGKVVTRLMNEEKAAGSYSIAFDASGLPSGIYIYRISTGFGTLSKKMTLIK